jgi:hypothetical protein
MNQRSISTQPAANTTDEESLKRAGKYTIIIEAFSKCGCILKKQPNIAVFAYGFIETRANAEAISKITDF